MECAPAEDSRLALAEIGRVVTQQASFLAVVDGFYFVAGVALAGGVFALLQKQVD